MTEKKIISIEDSSGKHQHQLHKVLRVVPAKDREDIALKRLLAFRLRTDGEGPTRDFLMNQIRNMAQCAYTGRLYDFLKDDQQSRECGLSESSGNPPDST